MHLSRRKALAVAFLFLQPAAGSSSRVFYASAVSYCSNARAIQVERFLLQYDAAEKSISFDISASAVSTNLRAILSFSLTAYGISALNTSINLCDELYGVLCPLPNYDFVGSATLPLPSSVTSKIKIPGIGFKIPDLEATAYVRLVSETDGIEAACLKVDLSNGRTTRHTYVAWALGGVALLSLLVGASGASVTLWKGGNVEFVATTGLLSLDYPLVFTSFVANFAWAIGIIFIQPFQMAIDETRARTGGNLTQVAGNLIGGTEATNSNLYKTLVTSISRAPNATLVSTLITQVAAAPPTRFTKRVAQYYSVPTVQSTDMVNSVASGIPRFLATINISPYNGFMTTFLTFLLLFAVFLAGVVLLAPVFFYLEKKMANKSFSTRRIAYDLILSSALRVLLISWSPILIFTFFQWTLGRNDSWAPIVLSVFTIIATIGALFFLSFYTLYIWRWHPSSSLVLNRAPTTALWNAFKPARWWFYFLLLLATFLRALFIAFSKDHGWVQTIGLLVIESLVFLLACIFTPFSDKSSNGIQISIMILRIIISGALIVFNSSISLNEIVRVAIGIVIAIIESVIVVGLFILVLIDAVVVMIRAIRRPGQPASKDQHAEKGIVVGPDDTRFSESRTFNDESLAVTPAEAKAARIPEDA